jgi:hypothetical protein
MRLLLFCVVVLGAEVVAVRAEAFCRTTTTTSSEPLGYNPAVSGCWEGGVPLHWSISQVPYGVAAAGSPLRKVTGAEATRVADLAFFAWENAGCDGGGPSIEGIDDGPLSSVPDASDCATSLSCDPEVHDVIKFDDAEWPYDDPVNTIALTTVSYGVDDGRIFEAFTEVNSAEQNLTTLEPPAADAYDLRAILTHEAGHFLGLAHATETSSIMYAYYQPGAIQLMPDDVNGICAVYPPAGSGGSCSLAMSRTSYGPKGDFVVVGFASWCALKRRWTRLRSRGSSRRRGG